MTETSPIASIGWTKSTLRSRSTGGAGRRAGRPGHLSRSAWSCGSSTLAPPRRCRGTAYPAASCRRRAPGSPPSYYNDDRGAESFTEDGWLRTGDVATIDPEGYIRLVDRTKDLIKSGGEWISSVELENELMAHPKIAEAAVIGVPHPKWSERPLACVVADSRENR